MKDLTVRDDTIYKFVETQGCTALGFTINGKDLKEISREEQKEIVDYICDKLKESIKNGTIFIHDLIKCLPPTDWGSEKEACDQCGDKVYWDIWEI
jgi:hypothetical protein